MTGDEESQAADLLRSMRDLVETLSAASPEAAEHARAVEASLQAFATSSRLSLAHYQLLFEEAPDPYLVTDRAGRIKQANSAARSLLGSAQDDLVGVELISFVTEDDRDEFDRWLERLRDGQAEARFDAVLDVESIATPVEIRLADDLDNVGYRWVLRNQQVRQAVERHLRDIVESEQNTADDLRAEAQARTAFLIALSHDLRAPIGALVHQAQLLGSDGLADDIRRRSVQSLRENAGLLAGMMDDLIDIERFAHGELKLDRRPTRLATLLGVIDTEVTMKIDQPDAEVWVDVDVMARAIRTLVSVKARRYPTSSVVVTTATGDSDVLISVRAAYEAAPASEASDASRDIDLRLIGALVEAHDGAMEHVDHGVLLRLPLGEETAPPR